RLARFDLILLDNRLLPNADFLETVPELRGIGYTVPIGVVSTDISGGYFQEIAEGGSGPGRWSRIDDGEGVSNGAWRRYQP
ncbi:hypothetical protein ACCS53_38405, partial [Rhizobium ruizarguesonis]